MIIFSSSKKSQAELITTVLIILISIAAVALLSAFILNFVRGSLKNTDCFQTTGQFSIDSDYSYFNSTSKFLYVSIKRADKPFNLSSLKIVFGNDKTSRAVTLTGGNSYPDVYNLKISGQLDMINRTIVIPEAGLSKAYAINGSSFYSNITRVSIFPILIGNQNCDLADEETISSRI